MKIKQEEHARAHSLSENLESLEKKKSYKIQIRENIESRNIFCIKLQQLGTGQKAEIRYKDDNTL